MKKFRPTIVACFLLMLGAWLSNALLAQHAECGTDDLQQMLQDPRFRQAFENEELAYQNYVMAPANRISGTVRKIPVVVHIIQCSDMELVGDADVYSQIEVLNEDFRRMAGTPGFGNGVDAEYEFCLATIDPTGCPTSGINRVVAPDWCYHDKNDAPFMKGLIQWDPRKYLNIWVPRTIESMSGGNQIIGYATFPTSLNLQANLDGVVIHSDYFGRNSNPTYIGRTTTHEVGHWLGLFHTFQDACAGATANTCASQGDRVCDTPQAIAANFGCPSPNSCTDSPTDLPDQIENYMDYANGSCQNMLTAGQKTRIDFYCNGNRSVVWSATNLTASGCDGTVAACAPSPDFKADNLIACVGQPVQFTDLSGLSPTSWNWNFTGGTPATATTQNPSVTYSAPGIYAVSLTAGNATGSNTENKVAYVEIVEPVTSPLVESFEGLLYLPVHWMVTDNGGINTWTLVNNAHSQGQNSMKVKNFEARNSGEQMSLHSKPFSLEFATSATMTFDHSYKKFSGLTSDGLKVFVSTDCGASWEEVWSKSGPYLATVVGNASTAEWVPTQASHWKSDTVSLDSFLGNRNVKVRFQVTSAGGQTIYLDNINMATVVGAAEPTNLGWEFSVAPNPFHQDIRIDYTLHRASNMDFYVTDISGKVLSHVATGRQGAGTHRLTEVEARLRDLPAGIYLLKGLGDGGTITRKLVKMN